MMFGTTSNPFGYEDIRNLTNNNYTDNYNNNYTNNYNYNNNNTNNNTDNYNANVDYYDDGGKQNNSSFCGETNVPTWIPAVASAISLAGLLCNAIAIFVIIVLKDFKKSISHWYVLQLAIADSIFLALLPLRILQDIRGEWNLPEIFCKMYQGIFMLNYYSGIFFLTVMSFDRYVAIVHPMSAAWRRFRTHSNAVLVTIGVWIISAIISLPLWIFSKKNGCVCEYDFPVTDEEFAQHHGIPMEEWEKLSSYDVDDLLYMMEYEEEGMGAEQGNEASCRHKPYLSFKIWVYTNFIIAFLLPVLVMTVCYSLILWRVLHPAVRSANRTAGRRKSAGESPPRGKLRYLLGSLRSATSSSSGPTGKEPKKLSQKQKVTTIVISLVIIFIICWLPFQINMIAKFNGINLNARECVIITDVTSLLAFANSMLNPIFYTFLGSRFYRRLSAATWSFFRGRGKSSRFTGFSYSRASRARAPSGGRSGTGNGTRISDASNAHHSVHSTLTSVKMFHPKDLRHPVSEDHDTCDSQRAHESVIEMKRLTF